MILGLFCFIVANAAVLLGTHALVFHLHIYEPVLRPLVFLLVRLLLISAVILMSGITGVLGPVPIGVAGAIAIAALVTCQVHRTIPRPGFPKIGRLLMLITLFIVLRLLLQVWFFAPHTGDVLSYRLPKIAEWIRAGRFTREMGLDSHATFPAGFELVETWWTVFLHHDALIEMAGVEFMALAFAATRALGKHVGLDDQRSFLAAILFMMTPGLHLQATSCLNDGPVAALVIATAALIAWRLPIQLALLPVGMGLGVKATYGFAIPGLMLLCLLVRKEPRLTCRSMGLSVGLALTAVGIGSYWYVRNAVFFGNPIYPMGDQEIAVQFGPRLSSFWKNFINLVDYRIYDQEVAYGAYLDQIAGWGPVGFACGIIGLIPSLRTDHRIRILTLAFLCSLLFVFLFVAHDDYYMRFVLFFPALLAICAVRLSQVFPHVLSFLGIGFLVQFIGTNLPYDLPAKDFPVLARQSVAERSAAQFFEANLPNEPVAYFAHNRGEAYILYRADFSRRVVYLRARSALEVELEMDRLGLRWLYTVEGPTVTPVVEELLQRGRFRRVSKHLYTCD